MVVWRRQDKAITGRLELAGGSPANVVVVADRTTPRSAALLIPQPGEAKPKSMLLDDALDLLDPADLVQILCMQERCFGTLGLAMPEELAP